MSGLQNELCLILDDMFLSLLVRSSGILSSQNAVNLRPRQPQAQPRSSQRRASRCVGCSIRVEKRVGEPSFRWRRVHG